MIGIGTYDGMKAFTFDRSYLWHYRAKLVRIIDGDTFVALVDTGFGSRYEAHIRIEGLWTPEMMRRMGLTFDQANMSAPEATEALALALTQGASSAWPLRIVTEQRKTKISEIRSMERWVADVYVEREGRLTNVLEALLEGISYATSQNDEQSAT